MTVTACSGTYDRFLPRGDGVAALARVAAFFGSAADLRRLFGLAASAGPADATTSAAAAAAGSCGTCDASTATIWSRFDHGRSENSPGRGSLRDAGRVDVGHGDDLVGRRRGLRTRQPRAREHPQDSPPIALEAEHPLRLWHAAQQIQDAGEAVPPLIERRVDRTGVLLDVPHVHRPADGLGADSNVTRTIRSTAVRPAARAGSVRPASEP